MKAGVLGAIVVMGSLACQSAKADFYEWFRPTGPYATEAEAIVDLKAMLKYASQCQYVSCNFNPPRDGMFRSCRYYVQEQQHFSRRYAQSSASIKTKHIEWYLEKISQYDDEICD